MTKRESIVFKAVAQYIKENGISPALRDLCEMTEINSTSMVLDTLHRLDEQGLIKISKGKRRAIQVLHNPYVDVVDVVRCKWCKYSEKVIDPIAGRTFRLCQYYTRHNQVDDIHFCGHGKRKGGAV